MSVDKNLSYETYVGNGSTTDFEFKNRIDNAEELIVVTVVVATGVATQLADGVGYNATGFGTNTITVTPTTVLPSTERIILATNYDFLQEVPFVDFNEFPAENFQSALDKATLERQQLLRQSDQSLKIPLQDLGSSSVEIPSAAARANKLLAFDESGDPITAEPGDSAPSDALSLTYNQGGPGAEDRTQAAKNLHFIHVDEYGAVEDSSAAAADNVIAINNAAAKALATGATLIDSGRDYYINGTVDLTGINVEFTGRLLIPSGTTPFTAVNIESTSLKRYKLNVSPEDLDWTSGGVCVHFKRGWYNEFELIMRNWDIGFLCDNDATSAGGSQENRITMFSTNCKTDHQVVCEVSTDYWNNNHYYGGNLVCSTLWEADPIGAPGVFTQKNAPFYWKNDGGQINENIILGTNFESSQGGDDTTYRCIAKMESASTRQISRNAFRDIRVEAGSSGLKHLIEYAGIGDILDNLFEIIHIDASDWDIVKEADSTNSSQSMEIKSSGEFWQSFTLGRPVVWYSGSNQRINLETYDGTSKTFVENTTVVHDFDGKVASGASGTAIGRRFEKDTSEPVFIELGETLEGLIVVYDSSGNRLTGTSPSYVIGDRDLYVSGNEGYRVRGKWIWLHQDVAEVFIGQASYTGFSASFDAYDFKVLYGTLKDKGITNPNPSSDTIPTAGIFQSGQIIGSQNGTDAGWVNSADARTSLTSGEPTSETSLEVDSISGISNGDIIGVQLDSVTRGFKDIHWTTVNGVPAGSTVVLSAGLPSAAAVGNEVIVQKYTAF